MKFRKEVTTLSSLTLCFSSVSGYAQNKDQTKPNIVFIYADDLGYGDISCNGAKQMVTPHIDKVAEQGLRFTNAHSVAATSTPSRYAMLTGEYAWRRKGTGIATGDAAMIIRPERYTLPDMFKDAGYTTAAIGKWHLGLGEETGKQDWNKKITPGLSDIGFDYSYIMAATGDRVPCVFVENGSVVGLSPHDPIAVSYTTPFPGEPTAKTNPELMKMKPSQGHDQSIINGIPRIGYMKGGKDALWKDEEIADRLTSLAVKYIEENKEKPFFLYFATQDAHVPRVPGERFAGKSPLGARGDVILQFDWSVGEVMAALKRAGIDDNTIVIISSDNGPIVDDGYEDRALELLGDHKPNGAFRGSKYSLYEAGTRIPCILRWPGIVKPGVSGSLLSQMDWFASFASLLNVPLNNGKAPDSENHLSAWLGKNRNGRIFLVEQNLNNGLALVTPHWKYIEPNEGPSHEYHTKMELGNSKSAQLYDMVDDTAEKKNVAAENRRLVEELHGKLQLIKNRK